MHACSARSYGDTPAVNLPGKAEPSGVAEPLMCLPPLFSRTDEPFDYNYQQHISKGALQACMRTRAPRVAAGCLEHLKWVGVGVGAGAWADVGMDLLGDKGWGWVFVFVSVHLVRARVCCLCRCLWRCQS